MQAEEEQTFLGCLLEDKQKTFHIKKLPLQQLQVLLGACSCSHLALLLRMEWQHLQQAEPQPGLHVVVLIQHVHYLRE